MTEHKGLWAALAAFQDAMPTLPKDAVNPHFKSSFTPLDTIVEKATPLLAEHGLSWSSKPSFVIVSTPTPDGPAYTSTPSLKYTLAHGASKETDSGEMLILPVKSDPQGQGSALTYARRYAMCAHLNIVADEDMDGETGESKSAAKAKPKPAKPKPAGPATIPETEVHALAAIYGVSGWKDAEATDPHATLRMQLAAVGANNEGDVKDCIRALTVEQGKTVRGQLEEARDIASGKIPAPA